MSEKPEVKYCAVAYKNPITHRIGYRPVITGRDIRYFEQIVDYALNSKYVRGKKDDILAIIRGFLRACKQLMIQGLSVEIDQWMRLHPELTGILEDGQTVDPNENELKMYITPLLTLKDITTDDFTWKITTPQTEKVVVTYGIGVGSDEPGIWPIGQDLLLVGRNLQFDPELGDYCTAEWEGCEEPYELTYDTSAYSFARFTYQQYIQELPDGAIITIKLYSRGGKECAETTINVTDVILSR